jgi:DNA-binding transcriptional MerR regulator
MASAYPIRAVSQLTGLGLDTLRAWERRHQAVKPSRGDRGRLYGEEDIRRLRLLRAATEAGHSIGLVAALPDAELESLLQKATPSRPVPAPDTQRLQSLLNFVEAYDSNSLEWELGRLALLLKAGELVHQVILPLMREAGERWEKGKFEAAHEHLLSASVRSLLGALVRRQETRGTVGKILFATPERELHEFGLLAAATLAVAQHFEAVYLGPNLPVDQLFQVTSALKPRAVVVAIMDTNVSPEVRTGLESLGARLPASSELWIGGSGARRVADPNWKNALLLDDLADYEQHLERLRL